jgi:hypothetical protein
MCLVHQQRTVKRQWSSQAPQSAVESNKHESKPRCGFEGGFTKVSLPELLNACKLYQKPAKETNMSDVLHAGHSMSADMQQSTINSSKGAPGEPCQGCSQVFEA